MGNLFIEFFEPNHFIKFEFLLRLVVNHRFFEGKIP